jgi:hypothetical protein
MSDSNNKTDLKDLFNELEPVTFTNWPKDTIAEEEDGTVYIISAETGAVYMTMPLEDYEAIMSYKLENDDDSQ